MFPQGLVPALVFGAAGARLKVHQRHLVAALRDQCRRISLEKGDDYLVFRIAVAGIRDRAIGRNQAILRLQLGDTKAIIVLDTFAPVSALPAVVSPLDPAALLCLENAADAR